MKKLLIIAGGTGGHIFPALVVAETLKKQGVLIEWLGAEVGMERQIVADHFPLYCLPIKALRGKSFWTKCVAPFRIVNSIVLAYRYIKKINPDVVLGMGGYASGPGGVAAWLLRKPLIIHEQNATPGLTNRWLSRIATTVLQAFPDAFPHSVGAITVGNPVRASIQAISKTNKPVRKKPLHVLVLGGSQGAQLINRLVPQLRAYMKNPEAVIFWYQTGKRDFDAVRNATTQCVNHKDQIAPFIEKMEEAYSWADVAICRAGALTVSELAAAGLPSILIPYPHAADNHQYANALFLVDAKAAIVMPETEMSADKLSQCLENLISSPQQMEQMSAAAKKCAQLDTVSTIIRLVYNLAL